MAASIKEKFGIDVKLIKSSDGAFEVRKDGELIFSKKILKRFPHVMEILPRLD